MEVVFWQGMISIHQAAFLEAVAAHPAVRHVRLVVERDIAAFRKDMGWEVPRITGVEITVAPAPAEIDRLVSANNQAVHVFGGIAVGAMITRAFHAAIQSGLKIGIMSETLNRAGIKGAIRFAKYKWYRMRYARHIDFILAIGRAGVSCFHDLGYNDDIIFPWAYFVRVPVQPPVADLPQSPAIIYAGRIEDAKGIPQFVHALAAFADRDFRLDIFGTGSREAELKEFVVARGLAGKIRFFPFLPYEELLKQYGSYNWVVLPSAEKDGWGVIISEGQLNGLRAITSNICGVSWIVTGGRNGEVFRWSEADGCGNALQKVFEGSGYMSRQEIQDWADRTISAGVGAAYFCNIVNHTYQGTPKPDAPWLAKSLSSPAPDQ